MPPSKTVSSPATAQLDPSTARSGELIRQALDAAGMSRSDLARALAGPGASPARVQNVRRLIQKWIKGDNDPGVDYAIRLAEIFGREPTCFVSKQLDLFAIGDAAAAYGPDIEALDFARQAVELLSEARVERDIHGPVERSEIRNLFPQFNPDAVLVDHVEALEPGRYIRATKRVSLHDLGIKYWYRNTDVVPAILLAEALAQTAAICLLAVGKNRKRLVLCASFNSLRFRRMVQDGADLVLESRIAHQSGSLARADVIATADGTIVVRGALTLAMH